MCLCVGILFSPTTYFTITVDRCSFFFSFVCPFYDVEILRFVASEKKKKPLRFFNFIYFAIYPLFFRTLLCTFGLFKDCHALIKQKTQCFVATLNHMSV